MFHSKSLKKTQEKRKMCTGMEIVGTTDAFGVSKKWIKMMRAKNCVNLLWLSLQQEERKYNWLSLAETIVITLSDPMTILSCQISFDYSLIVIFICFEWTKNHIKHDRVDVFMRAIVNSVYTNMIDEQDEKQIDKNLDGRIFEQVQGFHNFVQSSWCNYKILIIWWWYKTSICVD